MPKTFLHYSRSGDPELKAVIQLWHEGKALVEHEMDALIGYLQEWLFSRFWDGAFCQNAERLEQLQALRQSFPALVGSSQRENIERWLSEVHQLSLYPLEDEDFVNPRC